MKKYNVEINQRALKDIQEIQKWYNFKVVGLGTRFKNQTILHINSIQRTPYICAIRYDSFRCFLVKSFPFFIHYKIIEEKKLVKIFAIIHTSRNPKIWETNIEY